MSYTKSSRTHVWAVPNYAGAVNSSGPYHVKDIEDEKEKCLPMTVLADSVFGVSDGIVDVEESYYSKSHKSSLCYDSEQLELPLENPNALLSHYKKMIHKYERGYERMASFALKWYYLEQDAKDDEVIGKLLRDIQILRKLSGYNVV